MRRLLSHGKKKLVEWKKHLADSVLSRPAAAKRKRNRNLILELLEERIVPASVWIDSISNAEEGVSTGYFRLARDNSSGSLTVNYHVDSSSTATEGTDYANLPGSVTFADGQSTADVVVDPTGPYDDNLVEGDETVVLDLDSGCCGCGGSNYTLGSPSSGTLTISDNDVAPNVWIDSTSDAKEGAYTGYFRLQRDNTSGSLTVNYHVDTASTATQGSDYPFLPGTVTFADGQSTADVVIDPTGSYDDTLVEGDETVILDLDPGGCCVGNAYTLGSPSTATLTIIDNELVDNTLQLSAAPQSLTEGDALSAVTVATFTDADTTETADAFTATIDWGDGSPTSQGTVSAVIGAPGEFTIAAPDAPGHTYSKEGAYPLTITLSAGDGRSVKSVATVSVADAAINLTAGTALNVDQGQALTGVTLATFTDDNTSETAADFTATVDWGDGTGSGPATITAQGGGNFTITGDHTYHKAGAFTARIVLKEGHHQWVTTVNVDVAPMAVSLWFTLTPKRLSGSEGQSATYVPATFQDDDPIDASCSYTATIDWGDGTATTKVDLTTGTGVQDIQGDHQYTEAGNYLVTVTLNDEHGNSWNVYSTATISDAALTLTAGSDVTVATGQSLDRYLLAQLNDGSATVNKSDLTVWINWGDASGEETGTILGTTATFWIDKGHSYGETGTYTLWLTAVDDGGATAQTSLTVNVVPMEEGVSATVPLVTFYDMDHDGVTTDYTTTVDWGDGSTAGSGSVAALGTHLRDSQSYPEFNVNGSHAYSSYGPMTVVTTVDDTDNGHLDAGYSLTVAPAPPAGTTKTLTKTEGQALGSVVVASFTGQTDASSATIDWGDGSRSTGTITTTANGFDISGDHTYAEAGTFTITVLVTTSSGTLLLTGSSAAIDDAALTLSGDNGTAEAGVATDFTLGTLTDANPLATGDDLSVDVNWGDNTPDTLATLSENPDGTFTINGTHTYTSANTYMVTLTANDAEGSTDTTTLTIDVSVGSGGGSAATTVTASSRSNDPTGALEVPVGEAVVDPNLGGLRLSQELDFDLSPGTDVGRNPALVYNSSTVNVQPIVQVQVGTDPSQPLPASITAQLTWDGTDQGWVTFDPTGHQAGDSYVLALQVGSPVAATGVYGWSVEVQVDYGSGVTTDNTVSGQTPVVARDNSVYGAGWGIDGIPTLLPYCGGLMWVTGAGDVRLFTRQQDGTYTNPEDFGTLTQDNSDWSFTYTAKDQVTYHFDRYPAGASVYQLDTVTETHGLSWSYHYDTYGRLDQVTSIDGSTTALAYDAAGKLDYLTEPGSRTVDITVSSGALTQIVDADANVRSFGYDAYNRLTNDQWAPYNDTFVYSTQTGLLSQVNMGLGSVWNVTPALSEGLTLADASKAGEADLTDSRPYTTTYTLDNRGRELAEVAADGGTQSWVRNSAGLATFYTDQRGYQTSYVYNGSGDLTEEDLPDGSYTKYQYDDPFHEPTQITQAVTASHDSITKMTYNSSGDLLTETEAFGTAAAATTTYTWSVGLMQTSTDADSNKTTYVYDGYRRVTTVKQYDSSNSLIETTVTGYDGNGNVNSEEDGDDNLWLPVYSGANRLLSEQDKDAGGTVIDSSSFQYLASGLENQSIDADQNKTVTSYDQRGWETEERVTDKDLNEVSDETFQYDLAGNEKEIDTPTSQTLQTFDLVGRLKTMAVYDQSGTDLADEETYTYDLAGNQTRLTRGDGSYTTSLYNGVNEITQQQDHNPDTSVVDEEDDTYDEAGDVTRSSNPDGYTDRTYDDRGNVLTEKTYNTDGTLVQSFSYQYDGDGNVTLMTAGTGAYTVKSYDDNRLVGEDVYNADDTLVKSTSYGYDADGNQTLITDGEGNYTVKVYDDNRLTREEVYNADSTLVQARSYLYDGDGNMTEESDDTGAYTLRTFDDNRLMTEDVYNADDTLVRSMTNTYNEDGELTRTTAGDGSYTVPTYNGAGQVLTEKVYNSDGTLVRSVTNEYDNAGRLTTRTAGDGSYTTQTYNGAGAVLSENAYNSDGTLVRSVSNSYDSAERLDRTTKGDGSYSEPTYDGAGQVVREDVYNSDGTLVQTTVNQYDLAGNLVQVTKGDGSYVVQTYDGAGAVLSETAYMSRTKFSSHFLPN